MVVPDLTVLTWNVLAQAYVKPDRYPSSPDEALSAEARLPRILAHLQARDADVCCLQEVEPDVLSAIEAAMPHHTGLYAPRTGHPDGSALLFRTDAFRLAHEEALHFDADGHDHVAMVAQLAAGPRRLGVVSLHLRWQPPDTAPEAHLGRRQLVAVLDFIAEREGWPAWIVAGDFNAEVESAVIEAARARGYELSCGHQRPWDTVHIGGRRRKIDYLLITPDTLAPHPRPLPVLEPTTVMPSEVHPSDHLPVEVGYTWR